MPKFMARLSTTTHAFLAIEAPNEAAVQTFLDNRDGDDIFTDERIADSDITIKQARTAREMETEVYVFLDDAGKELEFEEPFGDPPILSSGSKRVFTYKGYGLEHYVMHSGCVVTVVQTLQGRSDGTTYEVTAEDGWFGYAHAEELTPLPVSVVRV